MKISSNFNVPVNFVTQTAAVLARKGAGKTYCASVLAEELLEARQQVMVIDPLDAWWGLRSSASGKKPGYSIAVFGDVSRHADLPLEPAMAPRIADLVAENPNLSCVLSLRHMRKNRQRDFVMKFAEQLFFRKGDPKLATPVHIFIDEADLFCPQRVMGDTARLVGAMEDLVRRGRQAGIGITMISQRPASVNKDVLTQVELLIVGQLTGPHDKKAIKSWIEENADNVRQSLFMKSLATLKVGTLWFWSPAWLDCLKQVKVRTRTTFDSSATPKAGAKVRAPRKSAPIDLKKIRIELDEALVKAEENNPVSLKKRVAQLEKELKHKAPAPKPVVDKAEMQSRISLAIDKRDREWGKSLDGVIKQCRSILGAAQTLSDDITLAAPKPPTFTRPKDAAPPRATPTEPPARRVRSVVVPGTIDYSEKPTMKKCERAVLTVLAQRGQACDKKMIAIQAGYSVTSGGFGQALADLRKAHYIHGGAERIGITNAGLDALGDYNLLPTGGELLEYWIRKLPTSQAKVLKALSEHGELSKYALSEITGYSVTSGGFGQALADLRRLRLINGGANAIELSEELT